MTKIFYYIRLGKIAIVAVLSLHSALQFPIALAAPTLTTVDNTGNTGVASSIAIGSDNLPIISYFVFGGNLLVAHCGDAGCTSGNTITTVDSSGNVDVYSAIAIGSDNLPIISYHDLSAQTLKVAHCGNTSCSSGNTLTTVDSNAGGSNAITIGADNLPIISYSDDLNLDLKVVHCGNNSCSSGNTITTVDGGPLRSGFTRDIAIGSDNLAVISYWHQDNGTLQVAHCGNTNCSSGNIISTVDTGNLGQIHSLAIGSDTFPILSYIDNSTLDLKVAHCGDISCSSGNTVTTVDSTDAVGQRNAIAIGADNLPMISYDDTTNFDLKFLHCGNTNCNSGNTITTIDSVGDVGLENSVAKGFDGFPVISYRDFTNGALKVAHCDNYLCDLSGGGGGGGSDAPFFSPWSLALLAVGIFVYLKREQLLFTP